MSIIKKLIFLIFITTYAGQINAEEVKKKQKSSSEEDIPLFNNSKLNALTVKILVCAYIYMSII